MTPVTATNAQRSRAWCSIASQGSGENTPRGGLVHAPGKKHRKPLSTDPGANIADSQAAKMRTAKTMQKTSRFRGRG